MKTLLLCLVAKAGANHPTEPSDRGGGLKGVNRPYHGVKCFFIMSVYKKGHTRTEKGLGKETHRDELAGE